MTVAKDTSRRQLLASIAAALAGARASAGPRGGEAFAWLAEGTAPASGLADATVDVRAFGARGDGSGDDGPAIARAASAAAGRAVWLPPGRYAIRTPVRLLTAGAETFVQGPRIVGAGPLASVLENHVTGAPMLDLGRESDPAAGFRGTFDVMLAGFGVEGGRSASAQTAIRLSACYNAMLQRLRLRGMAGTGLRVPCRHGDLDASNSLLLRQVRIEDCAGWGIDIGDPDHNETSLTRLEQVFVQNCGAASDAAEPPSGGMKWVGQIMAVEQSAFTLNHNAALYIPGQSGLASNIALRQTAFENNRGRHIVCTGVSGFAMEGCQLYNDDGNLARGGVAFDFSRFLGTKIDIRRTRVRATRGNAPYDAFAIGGQFADLNACRVLDTDWDNFDYRGQRRLIGWRFDSVPQSCQFVVETPRSATFKAWNGGGGDTPLRLGKAVNGDTPSRSGEWVRYRVPAGGIAATADKLAGGRAYYAYLHDSGVNMVEPGAIELSTTPPEIDAATGYEVKTGDATRLYVGGAMTEADGRFAMTGNGFLNAARVPGSQTWSYRWEDRQGRLRRKAVRPLSDGDGAIV